tara:strand:- start:216 stop:920 length:705 start_codon:yes stop_codon:yes gene_type:complete
MIILIGGMPRSGTTFLFNTVKEYFLKTSNTVMLHNVKTSIFMGKFLEDKDSSIRSNKYINICHYHDFHKLFHSMDNLKIIYTIRDPRDTLISQMKLQNWTFEDTLKKVDHAVNVTNHMIDVRNKIFFTYPFLIENRREAINRIFSYLDINLNQRQLDELEKYSSIENMKSINKVLFEETDATDFNNEFFFHSKHIQSGENERWKKELNKDQINFLTNRYHDFIKVFKLGSTKVI